MLFPSWLLVGLATLVSAANLTLSPFDIDISVANPVMRFAPIGPRTPDTQGQTNPDNEPTGAASVLTGGWELSYSDTDVPFENVTFTTLGVGTPKRSTNTSGATVTLDWVGTGIFFYGNTTDAAGFDVSVDGFPTNVNGTGGVLGGVTNLPFKQHQAVLTVTSGTLDLYSATITTALQTEGPDATAANITTWPTTAGDDKHLSPDWNATSTGGTPWAGRWDWAGTVWDHIGTTGQNATLEFWVPANTSYFELFGGTAGYNGDYQVSFSPPAPYDSTGGRGSEYSTWRGQDVLLWSGPLDPSVQYHMTLTTLLDQWWIDVSMAKAWTALYNDGSVAPAPPKNSSNNGALIGGIVGGVVGLLAIVAAVLLFIFFRNRKKRRTRFDILNEDTPMAFYDAGGSPIQPKLSPEQTRTAPQVDEGDVLLTPFVTSPSSPAPLTRASESTSSLQETAASTQTAGFSKAREARPPRRPVEITQQETDAGAVVVNLVPPSYDPSWSAPSASASPSASAPTPTPDPAPRL